MSREDDEKPALVEEIGVLEGLTVTKGPRFFSNSEPLRGKGEK